MNDKNYSRLVTYLQTAKESQKGRIDELKKDGLAQANKTDFLWHFLLASFATWGSSRGFEGLIRNQTNYNRVCWENIKNLDEATRLQVLDETLAAAKVRMAKKKAIMLNENATRIHNMGGVEKASDLARSQKGREAKMTFLLQFEGIGAKYARNIWMDVYDPDFRQSIAIDERIKAISEFIGVSFTKYEDHERFYLDLARELGMEGWELDRMLYWSKDEILKEPVQ